MNSLHYPIDIKELSLLDLTCWLQNAHIDAYRAKQIFKWIYLRQADSFNEMTDIKKEIRSLLSSHFTIDRLHKVSVELSSDGTKKYLFRLKDAHCIECVLIPEKEYYTLCVSSQVGCAQGCKFCLTARSGFIRNLTAGEILAQIRDVQHEMDEPNRLSNIVLMGMGEPLVNYKNVIQALDIITNREYGFNFSTRRVTLSTSGIAPKLVDLGNDTGISLAVSLNATTNEVRNMLMPINRKYPLEVLLNACQHFPLRHRRRITFEYILIKGINDSEKDARRLVKLLNPIKSKVNLIPFNPFDGCEFERSDESTIFKFQEILHTSHLTVMIRQSKGADISAACGQLRARMMNAI